MSITFPVAPVPSPTGPRLGVEVTLTGVPSVSEQVGGFPSGPVDGYPHPTSYRLVLDDPDGPVLIMPVGLWGDQPAAIFADVARRGFDVDVKAGSRRVGREQFLSVRRHGSGSASSF